MVYRNIFFLENQIITGTGNIIVEYTGRLYINAKNIKNIHSVYDATKDLMISCTSCARKKYKSFKKISIK